MDKALVVEHLVKSYANAQVKAVNDISFSVKKGSLFAFLGGNGAGKSTTINIICSILDKDSGKITIEGYDLDKEGQAIKGLIGVTFQNSVIDDKLTVYDNLLIRASFYCGDKKKTKEDVNRIIKLLELEPILNKQVRKLSGGQKRRVDIARAIVHSPKFLILDEPTTGLDPNTRLVVWNLIDKIRKETGMTVFLTTHYLEEADKATYVVIMDHGSIIAEGTPNELKNKYSNDYILCYKRKDEDFEELLNEDKIQFTYNPEHKVYALEIKDSKNAKEILNKYDEQITDFEIKKGNMDDVFLNVTGKGITTNEN